MFWVGVDDQGARWSASDTGTALRMERRDAAGALVWSGQWGHHGGPWQLSAAVTPAGEALFSATLACDPPSPACSGAFGVPGVAHASVVVKLRPDGTIRWARELGGGRLLGADASGGAALGWSTPPGASGPRVVKLDADGNPVWSKAITSIVALQLDRTGRVLATGCYQGDASLLEGIPCGGGLVAAALGPDGATLWTTHVDGYWAAIAADATGAEAAAAFGGAPFVLTSLSPEGAVRWSRPFGHGVLANQRGDPLLVAVAPGGPIAVGGYGYAPPPPGDVSASLPILLGFDAQGAAAFTCAVPGLSPATALAYGADGDLLLAVPAGSVATPAGRVEGAMIVDVAP